MRTRRRKHNISCSASDDTDIFGLIYISANEDILKILLFMHDIDITLK